MEADNIVARARRNRIRHSNAVTFAFRDVMGNTWNDLEMRPFGIKIVKSCLKRPAALWPPALRPKQFSRMMGRR